MQTKMAKKEEQQKTPYIWNLNADPQLSGMIYYLLKPGKIFKQAHQWLISSDTADYNSYFYPSKNQLYRLVDEKPFILKKLSKHEHQYSTLFQQAQK